MPALQQDPQPVLQLEALTLAFGGAKALSGVGFAVRPGSITAVVGPRGAGKTALFHTIAGRHPPAAGRVVFEGQDITRLPALKRAAMGLAHSLQDIAPFRGMTVLDHIQLGRHAQRTTNVFQALRDLGRARREASAQRREAEEKVIDFLEIDHLRHAPMAALPHALRKRVELARALAMQPRLLLLDAPVAGMDRGEREDMARVILDVRREWGITVLMAEDDLEPALDLPDHVVALDAGEVVAQGAPRAVRADAEGVRAGMGAGDVRALRRPHGDTRLAA